MTRRELKHLSHQVHSLTGLEVDLTLNPRYLENPLRPATGCAKIQDDVVRQEYRRVFDQVTTAKQQVDKIGRALTKKREMIERTRPALPRRGQPEPPLETGDLKYDRE